MFTIITIIIFLNFLLFNMINIKFKVNFQIGSITAKL